MKYKFFTQLVLLIASILCIWVIGVIIFTGAYFIEGIRHGNHATSSENIKEFFTLLSLLLFIFSVITAWFKRLTGSLLIIFFAVVQVILGYEPELAWLQISILFIGPLLFLFTVLERKLSAHGKTN